MYPQKYNSTPSKVQFSSNGSIDKPLLYGVNLFNKMKSKNDLTGQRFSKLTVINATHKKGTNIYYDCLCDCGTIINTRGASIKAGCPTSCNKCKIINLKGLRFSRLLVIKFAYMIKSCSVFECLCDCGKIKNIRGTHLKRGLTKSCGCLCIEELKIRATSHGCATDNKCTSEYVSWTNMKQRCYNPNSKDYNNYGGRGIIICDRWKNSFDNFLSDMGKKPNEKYSIDRINVNGNYEPSNCRWATQLDQTNNKRTNKNLTYNGETLTMSQWAKKMNIPLATIHNRIKRGLSVKDSLTKLK